MRIKQFNKACFGLWSKIFYGYPIHFDKNKKLLIDKTFDLESKNITKVADFGGIYIVNGAYLFYTIDKYQISKAIMIDTELTKEYLNSAKKYSQITSLETNFGNNNVASKFEKVDAIYLFDILLHQVNPNWDDILNFYSKKTKYFIIFNQMFTKSENSVRLLDLGIDEYFRHVPFKREHPLSQNLINKMYEINHEHDKIWRDIHHVFQWGITVNDLVEKLSKLNFELIYQKYCGQFSYSKSFDDYAFIFKKK